MKKFLMAAMFFITLLPIMEIDGYSCLSAQNMTFEDGSWWLPDVVVDGKEKETCDICGNSYDTDDPAGHECTMTCEYCREVVRLDRYEHHMETVHPNLDNDKSRCIWCRTLLTPEEALTHDCRNLTIPGDSGGSSGGGGSGGGSIVIGIGGGNGNGGNSGGNNGGNNNNTPSSSSNWKGLDDAIKHLNSKAISHTAYENKKNKECAKYVRLALQAGGIDTSNHPIYAKNYGSYLIEWGFHEIPRTNYKPQKGDIRIWQNYPRGNPAGHIHMYNGNQWVSDFFEPNDKGPGKNYRKYNNYKIYRK